MLHKRKKKSLPEKEIEELFIEEHNIGLLRNSAYIKMRTDNDLPTKASLFVTKKYSFRISKLSHFPKSYMNVICNYKDYVIMAIDNTLIVYEINELKDTMQTLKINSSKRRYHYKNGLLHANCNNCIHN